MKPWQVPKSKRRAAVDKPSDPFDGGLNFSPSAQVEPLGGEVAIRKLVQEAKSTGSLKEIPDSVFSSFEVGKRDVVIDMGATFGDTEPGWWGATPLTKLYLANNHLTQLPGRLAETFPHLAVLDLHGNGIRELPSNLGSGTALVSLNLARNAFSVVPNCIFELSLTDLTLANNQLEVFLLREAPLPQPLLGLTRLDLSFNKLKELPLELSQLQSLRNLKLNNNQLGSFPETVLEFKFLEHLDLSHNRIPSLPFLTGGSSAKFPVLKTLNAHMNRLTNVDTGPEADFGQLQQLILSDNQLTSIGKILHRTPRLTVLAVANNNLGALPDGLLELTAITQLDIACNGLTRLPPQLGNLTTLNSLTIAGNLLRAAPKMTTTHEFLAALRSRIPDQRPAVAAKVDASPAVPTNLEPAASPALALTSQAMSTRTVCLMNQKLDDEALDVKLAAGLPFPPASFEFQRNLLTRVPIRALSTFGATLTNVDLTMNRIEVFELAQPLPVLTRLCLANNRLIAFPFDRIPTLMPKLTTLDVSLNRIEKLTGTEVPGLESLVISGNRIVDLEPWLPFLTRLINVDLTNNGIKAVPLSLAAPPSRLERLELMGNPFLFPRHQVLQRGSAYLLEYLRARIPKPQ
ncbi:Leucine-rich repeat-containing protein 40 [Massospora cicadina]|nr:Leucine-rich repeat-containing protein 40 [Massospora cicadina]